MLNHFIPLVHVGKYLLMVVLNAMHRKVIKIMEYQVLIILSVA
ncbi:hypothetical protein HNQ85_001426 [Anoxybacillus calidus]|uniref:Uncharacterized protein n=1 Tax=[Anoxybacillus] calidus TaxID=575178 RepID=A0A7V9YZD9_9BACL|nr:hypothetical protein [Anoxybacillus calidus]MBA2871156.1 hypothetical protein [Anoxybacillus calidus]